MHRGYIRLWRKFREWEWYHDMPTRVLFLELLLSVTHKPIKYAGMELPVGSIVTGIFKLSEESDLTVKQVRRALSNLEKTGEIARKRASKYSIITMCNYAKYHGDDNGEGQAEGKQRASRGQLNKNEKKENNKKKIYKRKNSFDPFSVKPAFIEKFDWEDLVDHRRKVKATESRRAYTVIINQLIKAQGLGYSPKECIDTICSRSWRGFEAKWMQDRASPHGKSKNTRQENIDKITQIRKVVENETGFSPYRKAQEVDSGRDADPDVLTLPE